MRRSEVQLNHYLTVMAANSARRACPPLPPTPRENDDAPSASASGQHYTPRGEGAKSQGLPLAPCERAAGALRGRAGLGFANRRALAREPADQGRYRARRG